MANTPPRPIELGFPIQGLDRSLPARNQPPYTTYELMNVRAFPPSSDRLGGGTREGTTKLFDEDNQAGTTGSRRINGLDVITEATTITDPNGFAKTVLVEDWSSQAVADPGDLGANWYPFRVTSPSTQNLNANFSINGSQQLLMDTGVSSDIKSILCGFFVDQQVGISMVLRADGQADAASGGYGLADQCTYCGPVLAVSNVGSTGIMACFERVGADQVQAKIFEFTQETFVEKVASATFTLNGTATIQDYTITLAVVTGEVTATFAAIGALTGPADLASTLTYTTALSGQRGGGAGFSAATATPILNGRTVDSVTLTKLIPPANTIYSTIDPDLANPIDGNRFYIPSDFTGIARDNAGVITVTPGGTTSASDLDPPVVDTTTNLIVVSNPGQANADYAQEVNFLVYTDTTQEYGIICRPLLPSGASSDDDIASPIYRVSADGRNALILFLRSDDSVSGAQSRTIVSRIYGVAIVDNVATELGSILGTNQVIAFRDSEGFRATDDGTTIRFYINGILLYSLDPSSFANWTTGIGTSLSAYQGVGFTGGSLSGTGSSSRADFGKVEIVQGEVVASVSFDNVKNKIAIYSSEIINIGDSKTLLVTPVVGPFLSNPLPSSTSFNRKFYAVDGASELIIDPATNTSSAWSPAVTAGVLPAGCGLVASFRGSAYLAATTSDPTIWYKSRSFDFLDWDYGADPQVSSAVAGNNGEVGQPADAITALFPYSSDYLFFGMARSLGVLEGDPGYGGQFQIVSNETGIVGPRAYCFDDRGNLYFLGAGGLYRMFRAQFDPEPVGPRKLRRALEEIDTSANLIQMAFRPSDRTVRIFITPADGLTRGTHFVYDTRTDGFYSDQFPIDQGPWAIEQLMGVADNDRNIIIGGNDGYVRRPDDSAVNDDGTDISSWVEIIIPEEGAGGIETICQELQFVMGEGGAAVQWFWFVGDSPEEVRLQTVANGDHVDTGVIQGTGFRPPVGLRQTGAAHKIRLSATSGIDRWSLERLTAQMAMTNNRRR